MAKDLKIGWYKFGNLRHMTVGAVHLVHCISHVGDMRGKIRLALMANQTSIVLHHARLMIGLADYVRGVAEDATDAVLVCALHPILILHVMALGSTVWPEVIRIRRQDKRLV